MSEVSFECDIFVSELLCDRCSNADECEYDGTDEEKACEVYKYLEAHM